MAQDYTVVRIVGADRYETAVRVGQLIMAAGATANQAGVATTADTVIVATRSGYPDALSIAPFAGAYGLPDLPLMAKRLP